MMQPLITFCTTDGAGAFNGINTWLLRLLPALRSKGLRIRVLVFSWSNRQHCVSLPHFEAAGFPVDFIDYRLPTDVAAALTLDVIAKARPNAFVANMVLPALYACRRLRDAGIPSVAVLHNDDRFYRTLVRVFGKRGSPWAVDRIVCVSKAQMQMAASNVPPEKLRVIPHGIEANGPAADQAGETLRLIYAGRIVQEQKRIIETARALILACRTFKSVEADIIGSGPQSDAVRALIAKEATGLPVRFHGRIEYSDIPDYLRRANAFVLLSDYEGLPISLLEAMSAGLVPICHKVRSGIPDLIRHGYNGLIAIDRTEDFLDAVRVLLRVPTIRQQLAQSARSTVLQQFPASKCADDWENLLLPLAVSWRQELLNESSPLRLPPRHSGFGNEDKRPYPIWRRAIRRLAREAQPRIRTANPIYQAGLEFFSDSPPIEPTYLIQPAARTAGIYSALLVPCYNASEFLPRLASQIKNLQPSFDEVILADDASKDCTAALAGEMGFRVLRLPQNLGPGGARNALARASQAEWIHFHDADDVLASDYLAQVRLLATSGADIVFHFVDFIKDSTRDLIMRWDFPAEELQASPAARLLAYPMPTMSTFLRRQTFLDAGGFREDIRCFEDGDLHFRLALNGARVAALPRVLEWSLRREGSASSNLQYCFRCRLRTLEHYASTVPEGLVPIVAHQAERCAAALLTNHDLNGAQRAISLAMRFGQAVPHSENFLMRRMRNHVHAIRLLQLQTWWRSMRQ
jgi:colanic acid/amylovoran biosynthesis glycosyltransferase